MSYELGVRMESKFLKIKCVTNMHNPKRLTPNS